MVVLVKKNILITLAFVYFLPSPLVAYDNKYVHPRINSNAVEQSVLETTKI